MKTIYKEAHVIYCTPVDEIEIKTFATVDEAVAWVKSEMNGYEVLDNRDTDNGNNHHWFEVYDGEPIVEDEDGDFIANRAPVFISEKVYNK